MPGSNAIVNKVKHALTDAEAFTKTLQKYTGIKRRYDKIEYPYSLKRKLPEPPHVVTCTELGFHGELGNQMFQIAAVIGYARRHQFIPRLPYWYCRISQTDYAKIFAANFDQSLTRKDLYHVQKFDYQGLQYKNIPVFQTPVDLAGYFQSEQYFAHCTDEIKSCFEPSAGITQYIHEKYAALLNTPNKVCLQVRTGKRSKNDFSGHAYVSAPFIQQAMTHFDPEALFVVFADQMDAAKKMLPAGKNYFFVEKEKNYVDLFLMNEFANYILSPSTFGWWGAWLSKAINPKVVIQKEWFVPKGRLNHYCNNDIVPERWIKL